MPAFHNIQTQIEPSVPKGYALLFAVNEYSYMMPLKGAVADARSIAKVLLRLDFTVLNTLYDDECSPATIERALVRAAQKLPERARLFVFFAGHGLVHTQSKRVFYATKNSNVSELLTTAFDLEKLHSLRDFLPRHQLFVFDFCYSGGAVVRSRSNYADFSAPSVQFVSAGSANQQVSEVNMLEFQTNSPLCTPFGTPQQSPKNSSQSSQDSDSELALPVARLTMNQHRHYGGMFASVFVFVLQEVCRLQRGSKSKRRVSASEVFLKVRRRVLRTSKKYGVQQTPQMERIPYWRDVRAEGDFLF